MKRQSQSTTAKTANGSGSTCMSPGHSARRQHFNKSNNNNNNNNKTSLEMAASTAASAALSKETTSNTKKKKTTMVLKKAKKNEPPFSLYYSSLSSPSTTATAKAKATTGKEQPSSCFSFDEGFESVIQLLRGAKKIVVLTGAGISVSCGIPDFRSKGTGLYSTLDAEDLGLSCPEDLFDFDFFLENPQPFFQFARNLYFPLGNPNDQVRPSDSHKLLALLEQKHKLLRVYSQNIDSLEQEAGVSSKKVVYAHGSLKWATCCKCKRKVDADTIKEHVLKGVVATCQAPIATSSTSATATAAAATTSRSSGNVKSTSTTVTRSTSKSNHNKNNHNNKTSAAATAASSRSTRKRQRANGVDHKESLLQSNQSLSPTSTSSPTSPSSSSSSATATPVCGGVLKPGVTFFGEALHDNVRRCLEADRNKVDALIVMGTSLSVAPMSKVVEYLPPNIPRILINRTIVHPSTTVAEDFGNDHDDDDDEDDDDDDGNKTNKNSSSSKDFRGDDYVFDAYLLGFCDDVSRALVKRLFPEHNNSGTSSSSSSDDNDKANHVKSSSSSSSDMKKKRPRSSLINEGKLLASLDSDDEYYNKQDWALSEISSKIPPERIFLFPGAIAPVDATDNNNSNNNTNGKGDGSELTYREIAHCDGCSERIVGTIHKCVTCFDFDLCQTCFPKLSKEHHGGKHPFVEEMACPLVAGEN